MNLLPWKAIRRSFRRTRCEPGSVGAGWLVWLADWRGVVGSDYYYMAEEQQQLSHTIYQIPIQFVMRVISGNCTGTIEFAVHIILLDIVSVVVVVAAAGLS